MDLDIIGLKQIFIFIYNKQLNYGLIISLFFILILNLLF